MVPCLCFIFDLLISHLCVCLSPAVSRSSLPGPALDLLAVCPVFGNSQLFKLQTSPVTIRLSCTPARFHLSTIQYSTLAPNVELVPMTGRHDA